MVEKLTFSRRMISSYFC